MNLALVHLHWVGGDVHCLVASLVRVQCNQVLCCIVFKLALGCLRCLGIGLGLPMAKKHRGRKIEDHDVPHDDWVKAYEEHIDQRLAQGDCPLALASYAHLQKTNAVCLKSLVQMEHWLAMILARVPGGVLNQVKHQKVLEIVGGRRPQLVKTSKSLFEWSDFLAKKLRIALAHLRNVAMRPKVFEPKMRLMSEADRAKLLELLAKVDLGESLESVADSLEDTQEPMAEVDKVKTPKKRILHKTATDDLDFSVGLDIEKDSTPKQGGKGLGIEERPQAKRDLMPPNLLLKALMASPVSAKLKTRAKVESHEALKRNVAPKLLKKKSKAKKKTTKATTKCDKEEEVAEDGAQSVVATDRPSQTRTLWVTKATKQSYIQEAKMSGGKQLIISVTEKMSTNHHQIIDTIKAALEKDVNMGKEQAKALRNNLLGLDCDLGK